MLHAKSLVKIMFPIFPSKITVNVTCHYINVLVKKKRPNVITKIYIKKMILQNFWYAKM